MFTVSSCVPVLALLSLVGPAHGGARGEAPPAPVAPRAEVGAPVVIPGEYVIAFRTDPAAPWSLTAELEARGLLVAGAARPDLQGDGDDAARRPANRVAARATVDDARLLLRWVPRGETRMMNLVRLRLGAAGAEAIVAGLSARPDVAWVEPNLGILEDPRELVPNDPQFGDQYHHPLMDNIGAWDITLGDRAIITAVTDDGVDLDHEDLATNIWLNVDEIPGNSVDDDGNGYVDDVNGWDVLFDNNDPNPNGGDDHGTHVAGIAAASTDNGVGVSGTAGRSTIMPVQFYASGQPWTAADIAEAFGYAADNGARIVSTSYNINGWVGNPIVTAAFDALYDQDVLHFNSAGNGNDLNPPRQSFHQTFLVANTTATDQRSGSSNYGTGVDVSAPGSSILSTILNDGYGLKSGTSMSTPNAAGVAALIWSQNPTWTRDQVVAQLLGTADNIDAANPGLEGLLGSGRVNSFRALTESLPAPRVREASGLPSEGETVYGELTAIEIRFDQVMDPATVNGGGFTLTAAGPDGVLDTGDDSVVAVDATEYLTGANSVSLVPGAGELAGGLYRFDITGATLANPFGTALDGDGDGEPGGDWSRSFVFCPGTVISEDTLESGLGWSVQDVAIDDGAWDLDPTVPVGGGDRGDPAADFDGSGRCFLTDNVDGNSDVDGGPTRLISPAIDVSGVDDPWISYARWFTTDDSDVFRVELSADDGATWALAELVASSSEWGVGTVRVADLFPDGADAVRLRFTATDNPNDSVVEAGVDRIRVLMFECSTGPIVDPADVDGDGIVGLSDLLAVLSAWGPCGGGACPADVNGDGQVGLDDLLAVLAGWV